MVVVYLLVCLSNEHLLGLFDFQFYERFVAVFIWNG